MQTFRHFVAIGVGAAIALSSIESDASRKLPSSLQAASKPAENSDAKPSIALAQSGLSESLQTAQQAELPVEHGNAAAPVTSVLGTAASNSQAITSPQQTGVLAKLEVNSQPVVSVANASVEGGTQENHQASTEPTQSLPTSGNNQGSVLVAASNRLLDKEERTIASSQALTQGNGSVPQPSNVTNMPKAQPPELGIASLIVDAYKNQPSITAPLVLLKPTQDATPQPVLSQVALNDITSSTSVAAAAYARLQAARAFERNLAFPPVSTDVAQLVASANPQPTQVAQNTPPPDYLNPSPNPLLFPTRSQEVQVQTLQPITLEQALELAQRNNRDLQAAQLNLERSRFGLQQALAAEFPTASVVADFNRSESAQGQLNQVGRNNTLPAQFNQPPYNQPPLSDLISFFSQSQSQTQNRSGVTSSFSTGLQVSYDLYTAGSRPAQIRQAEQQTRVQQLEVERITQQLRLDVSTTYYNLQQAEAQVEIARAAVADATQSLRDAVLREQAGLGTRFDVLQAQVSLANANQDLTRALSQLQIRRRQLTQLLNLNQGAEVSALDPIGVAGQWNLSLEQSIVLAIKNRAELEQQLLQRDINEQQRIIALAATRPQVSLTANYNITGVLNDGAGPRDGLTLGAGMRWNFFDGGAARARANQARTDIALAENNFAEQRNQVRLSVEQAFFDLNSSAQNIQTASFALVRAEESLRLARLRFQAGVGTQTDVINQQTELTRARGNRITAILDYNRALASLQRAVSNLPDSNLFDVPN